MSRILVLSVLPLASGVQHNEAVDNNALVPLVIAAAKPSLIGVVTNCSTLSALDFEVFGGVCDITTTYLCPESCQGNYSDSDGPPATFNIISAVANATFGVTTCAGLVALDMQYFGSCDQATQQLCPVTCNVDSFPASNYCKDSIMQLVAVGIPVTPGATNCSAGGVASECTNPLVNYACPQLCTSQIAPANCETDMLPCCGQRSVLFGQPSVTCRFC